MKRILFFLLLISSFAKGQQVAVGSDFRTPHVFNVKQYGADNTGTNDATAAIQTTINACSTAGGGDVFFPLGTYKIAGALQTSISGTNPNSQLYIPSVAITSGTRNSVRLIGESTNTFPSGYSSSVILGLTTTGVILKSTLSSASGTNPSVIGTIGTTGNYSNFNYTDIYFENITIQTYTNSGAAAPVLTAINMQYAAKVSAYKVSVGLDVTLQSSATPSSSEVAGFIVGNVNNDGPNNLKECFVYGYKYGYIFGEHTSLENVYSVGNFYGAMLPNSGFTVTGKLLIHGCPHGLYFPNGTVMGFAAGVSYVSLFVEQELDNAAAIGTFWYNTIDQVTDAGNNGIGNITIQNMGVGGVQPITVTGAANLKINALNTGLLPIDLGSAYYTTGFAYRQGDLTLQSKDISNNFLGFNTQLAGSNYVAIKTGAAAKVQSVFSDGGVAIGVAPSVSAGATQTFIFPVGVNNSGQVQLGNNVSFTMGSWVDIAAPTTARASMNFASGVDPSSSNAADIWNASGVLKFKTLHLAPAVTATNDLGTSSLLWRDIYARGIVGVITNSNAQTGSVGEYVSSLVAIGSPVSLSNGIAANITSISLTAGDWDVTGTVSFTETTSTVTARSAGITSTTGVVPVDGSEGYCGVQSTVTSETNSITIARTRFSLSGTTTIFLVGKASFSAGTCGGFGNLSARRVR
jgi:hypothetical protein